MGKKSILIVDDEVVVSLEIKKLLQGWGYKVCGTVGTGEDALNKIEEAMPDLVLMDINLRGGIDGIETSKLIKDKYKIPIIYLTAYIDYSILKRVEKTNPYGYILKPFNESELYAVIKIALYNSKTEKELEHQYLIQSVLNTILGISLEPLSLTEQMKRVLDKIITLPWLKLESKGSIFLVEETEDVLELKVHKGFSPELLEACSRVPFGTCLCGKAAASRNIVFSDCIDDRHDITFEKMTQHGHFCIPIILTGKLLGVINLYLKEGHKKNEMEEEFLVAVSNTLAGIIARRSTEEALEKLKRQQELILNSAGEGIFGLDRNGLISFVNPAAAKMIGWDPEELLGKKQHDVIHHPNTNDIACYIDKCNIYKAFFEGQVYRVDGEVFWRKDGTSFPVEYVSTPIFDEKHRLLGAVVVFNDTSLRKQAEEQQAQLLGELKRTNENLRFSQEKIIQSEKLAALGQLVSGIAHEINTPIGNSVMSASHLVERTREITELFDQNKLSKSKLAGYFSTATEDSDIILKNLIRSSTLVKSFKMVSGDQTSQQRRRFRLKEYIEDIIMSLKPTIKKTSHEVHVSCGEDMELDSYPGAFAQIITNLVMNAITHAFDKEFNGHIDINVRETQKNIIITFKDNGKGISNAAISRIFDPFFTTNRKGGNSGLGLNIVFNIVQKTLKGDVHCESVEGEGTSFIITIPREL
ncbi:ATP-binding protein [Candidatus Magnetominusculus xianensis]|uniref:histidine kinase n=1 Tax=Candidatus Magnetominusculus xianensis TaxID=1748249 RepID=A0ABR5SGL3_9BACT|nr:ATP-binding protein [Candidatus Magnetominusculus xianensis]KWT85549.1 histidine kinase [Candidatus Magnetominusculus xianensis]MBF0404220.1 response regulator [Nitrospirota bacterium]